MTKYLDEDLPGLPNLPRSRRSSVGLCPRTGNRQLPSGTVISNLTSYITLSESYVDPVVVTTLQVTQGSTLIRLVSTIINVSPEGFTVQLIPFRYQEDVVAIDVPVTVHYFAVESGVTYVVNNSFHRTVAGTYTASAGSSNAVNVSYELPFDVWTENVIVIPQLTGTTPLAVRLTDVGRDGFSSFVTREEQDANVMATAGIMYVAFPQSAIDGFWIVERAFY